MGYDMTSLRGEILDSGLFLFSCLLASPVQACMRASNAYIYVHVHMKLRIWRFFQFVVPTPHTNRFHTHR